MLGTFLSKRQKTDSNAQTQHSGCCHGHPKGTPPHTQHIHLNPYYFHSDAEMAVMNVVCFHVYSTRTQPAAAAVGSRGAHSYTLVPVREKD